MLAKIKQSNILFAVVFLTFISVFGIIADKNLYRLKYYGESNSNYDFGEKSGDIQTEYAVNFPCKPKFIDMNGFIRKLVGQREMNGVVKLNNGYLTEVAPTMSDDAIAMNAEAIIQYDKFCKEHDIVLLYVCPAYKISKYDDELPAGVDDGHNETVDELLFRLTEANVSVLDLRECMHIDNIDQYSLYYVSDHHWTTKGAFYGYQQIAKWISENTNTYLDKDLLNINNYQIDTYDESFLGSRGQRTGALFGGIDDFDLIYPKFDTHILNDTNGNVTSLKDALVDMKVFENRNILENYINDTVYNLNEINQLTSQDAKTNLSVLMLGDSFQYAIKPYMLMTYKEFNTAGWGLLHTSVLSEFRPNVVVILPWPGYYSENKLYFEFLDNTQWIENSQVVEN